MAQAGLIFLWQGGSVVTSRTAKKHRKLPEQNRLSGPVLQLQQSQKPNPIRKVKPVGRVP